MEPDVIAWDAPEYHFIERNSDWYWMLGIIAVCLAVLSILFDNLLFGLFILLGALTTGLYASREPKLTHVELQPRGVVSHDLFYEYKDIESFWMDEHHPLPRIIMKSKKKLMTHIIIPVSEHVPADEVRAYLVEHIPEVEHHQSAAHKILEHIGL